MARNESEERGGGAAERRRARADRREKGRPEEGRSELLEWVKTIAIALVIFVILRSFVVQTYVITSGSMEDSLLVGDHLIVNRMAMGGSIPFTDIRVPGYSEPDRGEILVFDPPHEEDLMLVKRMVGMPGDTLRMENKVLFVNGEPADEPYVKWEDPGGDDRQPQMDWQREYVTDEVDPADYRPTRDNWGPLVVPEDKYFALGDNRDYSLDSRYWGLLEGWRLEGRASLFYYSYDIDSPRSGWVSWLADVRPDRIGRRVR